MEHSLLEGDAEFQTWLASFSDLLDGDATLQSPFHMNIELSCSNASTGGVSAQPPLLVGLAGPAPLQANTARTAPSKAQDGRQRANGGTGKLTPARLEHSRRSKRRAQERHAALQAEAAAKEAELKQLQQRNAELLAREEALKCMVSWANTNLALIKGMASMQLNGAPEPTTSTAAAAAGTGPAAAAAAAGAQRAGSGSSNGSSGADGSMHRSGSSVSSGSGAGSGGGVTYGHSGTPRDDEVIPAAAALDAAPVSDMREALAIYNAMVEQLTPVMLEVECLPLATQDSKEVDRRIGDVIVMPLTRLQPWVFQDPKHCFKGLHLQTGEPITADTAPDPGHWAKVAAVMQVDTETLGKLEATFALLKDKLAPVKAKQRLLLERIRRHAAGQAQAEGRGHASQMDCATWVQQLQELLCREHQLDLMFECACFDQFLSFVAMARLILHSYPYYPELELVLKAMREQART